MSRLTRLLNQCGEKRRYPSRKRAETAREKTERMLKKPMHSYYCQLCKGFHLASGKQEKPTSTTQQKQEETRT